MNNNNLNYEYTFTQIEEIHAEIAWRLAWNIIESIELDAQYPKLMRIKAPVPLLQITHPTQATD